MQQAKETINARSCKRRTLKANGVGQNFLGNFALFRASSPHAPPKSNDSKGNVKPQIHLNSDMGEVSVTDSLATACTTRSCRRSFPPTSPRAFTRATRTRCTACSGWRPNIIMTTVEFSFAAHTARLGLIGLIRMSGLWCHPCPTKP